MPPEALARQEIDAQLAAAGWFIQDRDQINLHVGMGVAVREFPLAGGYADYLLFAGRKAVGVIEAKVQGATLSGVAEQAAQYVTGLPANIPHVALPLPFQYVSTGVETLFRDNRDPQPRSRRVFCFHRPETLAEWADEAETFRRRVQHLPPLDAAGLWPAQAQAIHNLEDSLAEDRPRALIQMATGSGKTFTAVSAIYRLIKFTKARRVLFLVDRSNLARQAYKEFQAYTTPDDGRKFTELYNAQHLQSNAIDPVNKVVITTIQRLYSILSGEAEFIGDEEGSLFELGGALEGQPPRQVHYNPRLPVEFFDFIITDECHRSIYNLWRGVLEYFDAYLIGLTATPSKQTLGFFNQNLVMEYSRQRAVADGVNVDGEAYRIRTRIGEQGNTVEAGEWVGRRDKLRRAQRLELLDQDFAYDAEALDRSVVAPNQIRTVLQTFKERLPLEIFPGRSEVPKTLVFAKDDSHAEDIVTIAREVFGRGDEFCKKITYRTTGVAPEQLISDFRTAYHPRIAVTVDMVATGTDIKPVEILVFMRAVKSRILFEQMLGRGTRVIGETDLQAVNPGEGVRKDHFVIVDVVGILEQEKVDTQTLERKRSTPFAKLLEMVAVGAVDEDVVASLAGRLIRLRKDFSQADDRQVDELAGAGGLPGVIDGLLAAIDPDRQEAEAVRLYGAEPGAEQIAQAAGHLLDEAVRPLAANPPLRNLLVDIQRRGEQVMDESADETTLAAFDEAATERARATVASFEAFIAENRDEITALQIIYNIPRGEHVLRTGKGNYVRGGEQGGSVEGQGRAQETVMYGEGSVPDMGETRPYGDADHDHGGEGDRGGEKGGSVQPSGHAPEAVTYGEGSVPDMGETRPYGEADHNDGGEGDRDGEKGGSVQPSGHAPEAVTYGEGSVPDVGETRPYGEADHNHGGEGDRGGEKGGSVEGQGRAQETVMYGDVSVPDMGETRPYGDADHNHGGDGDNVAAGRSRRAMTFDALRELAEILQQPPRSWTTEALWRAYATLERDRVRGANQRRVLTDIVALVRHAVQLDDELLPYPERVALRYQAWIAAQESAGRQFTPQQRWWLDKIAEHIGVNLAIGPGDLQSGEFFNQGGQLAAARLFGPALAGLLQELNVALGEPGEGD
ncbi:MAG: DEAD/DEAH box helicase family protein [Chloroflexota bacterium]